MALYAVWKIEEAKAKMTVVHFAHYLDQRPLCFETVTTQNYTAFKGPDASDEVVEQNVTCQKCLAILFPGEGTKMAEENIDECICVPPSQTYHNLTCPRSPMHGIYMDLIATNTAVDKQIKHHCELAEQQGINPYEMRDSNGGFMLTPLLTARAQCLSAIALLRYKEE